MRHILVILSAIVISMPSFSQDLPDYLENKNEFNIGYFNAFQLNAINDLGIGYKRSTEKGAIRLSTGIRHLSSVQDRASYQEKGYEFQISPKIGYEYHQWFNKIRLHYGADLVGSFQQQKDERIYDNPDSNFSNIYSSQSYGIRPILGLTFFINKTVSISTETYMNISYYKSTSEDIYQTDTNISSYQGMAIGLGPLGIVSINLHF